MNERERTSNGIGPLIPLSHWNRFHNWPPQGGLRHLVFHAQTNGFNKVIKRVGRRILIDEAAFFAWVDEQNQNTDEIR